MKEVALETYSILYYFLVCGKDPKLISTEFDCLRQAEKNQNNLFEY